MIIAKSTISLIMWSQNNILCTFHFSELCTHAQKSLSLLIKRFLLSIHDSKTNNDKSYLIIQRLMHPLAVCLLISKRLFVVYRGFSITLSLW